MLDEPVTTQFISNVERGVTPLPPVHVPTLSRVLSVSTDQLARLLEQEYAARLNGRLGTELTPTALAEQQYIERLWSAFHQADHETKESFVTFCASVLQVARPVL